MKLGKCESSGRGIFKMTFSTRSESRGGEIQRIGKKLEVTSHAHEIFPAFPFFNNQKLFS